MVRGTLFEEVGFALERDNAHKAEGVGDVVDILVTEGALCTGECGVGSGAPRAPGPCRSPRCDVRVGRRCGWRFEASSRIIRVGEARAATEGRTYPCPFVLAFASGTGM